MLVKYDKEDRSADRECRCRTDCQESPPGGAVELIVYQSGDSHRDDC